MLLLFIPLWTGCQSLSLPSASVPIESLVLKKSGTRFTIMADTRAQQIDFPEFVDILKMSHLANGVFDQKMRQMIQLHAKPNPERQSVFIRSSERLHGSLRALSPHVRDPGILPNNPTDFNSLVISLFDTLLLAPDFEIKFAAAGDSSHIFNLLQAHIKLSEFKSRFVPISDGVELQKNELTQGEFFQLFGFNPANFSENNFCQTGESNYESIRGTEICSSMPVESIAWNDVQVLLQILNRKIEHFRFSLPTMAQWQFAVLGRISEPTDDDLLPNLDEQAWWLSNSKKQSRSVGTRQPSATGAHDLLGNVWELMADKPQQWAQPNIMAMRGGSWGSIHRAALKLSNVRAVDKEFRGYQIGFRLTRKSKTH